MCSLSKEGDCTFEGGEELAAKGRTFVSSDREIDRPVLAGHCNANIGAVILNLEVCKMVEAWKHTITRKGCEARVCVASRDEHADPSSFGVVPLDGKSMGDILCSQAHCPW